MESLALPRHHNSSRFLRDATLELVEQGRAHDGAGEVQQGLVGLVGIGFEVHLARIEHGQLVAEAPVVPARLQPEARAADGGLGEGDVLVQRRMLVATRRLDRRDDLARDAQLREVAERGLAVGPEVADRLVEADQALLDQVVGVAAPDDADAGE